MSIRSVTVYCSSSSHVAPVYAEDAAAMGAAIARAGWTLVYGGNAVGLMGAVANGARHGGGKVVGITTKLLDGVGISDAAADELVVAESMRPRKEMLEARGDAFVALPGGIGTFEELFEILVGKQLRYHTKPIVLLNTGNYYRPLLQMMEHGIDEQFIKPTARNLYFVADTVPRVIEYLQNYQPPEPSDKWFSHTPASPG